MKPLRILNIFHRLMPSGAEVMWIDAEPFFRAQGIQHVLLSVDPELGPFAEKLGEKYKLMLRPLGSGPWGAKSLAQAAKDTRADLIHCHSESKGMAAALAGRITGIPVVRTYHNIWSSTNLKHRIRRGVESKLVTRIAVGASVHGVESHWGRVDTILNWANSPESCAVPTQESTLKLVTICNTNEIKRCDLMLELISKHPELDLTHIGFDSLGVFGSVKLAKMGLGERVRSLGPRDKAVELLPKFDCYVCTSQSEGFSIALTEAILTGLPLAISDTPGVRDMLEFCPKAFTIDLQTEKPFAGLAQSIKQQTEDYANTLPSLRRQFSPERGANEYVALYRRLCGG